MTVVPMERFETKDCKTPDCTGEANTKYDRGPYSGLCDSHIEQKRKEISAQASERWRERNGESAVKPGLRAVKPEGQGFEKKAKALVAVGRKLDRAVGSFKRKQASLEPAKQALDQAMREWRTACRDLAGDQV